MKAPLLLATTLSTVLAVDMAAAEPRNPRASMMPLSARRLPTRRVTPSSKNRQVADQAAAEASANFKGDKALDDGDTTLARSLPREVNPIAEGARLDIPAPDPNDPARERILRLQEQLTGIVDGPVLGGVRVGMRVIDAATGRTFFRHGGTTMMDPASNQKVLATTAALMRLGAGFRFRTELTGPAPDGNGVITGDLTLRGMGDPSLRMVDLEALATSLAARGVLRIEGGIAGDPRRIGSTEMHPDERTPLRVSRTFINIRVRPSLEGLPPLVTIKPEVDSYVIRNKAVTGGRSGGRGLRLTLTATNDRIIVDLSGRLSANHPGLVMRRIAPDQRLFTAALMRRVLTESGIQVRDPARVVDTKTADRMARERGDTILAVHQSEPLSVLVRRINKDSDNEWADRLLDVVGAELFGGPALADKGLRALREAMDDLGLPRESYVPSNGSGLGHGNRMTADALAELLHKIYLDPRWGPEMLQSFSVGGVDGTTRNRFRGSPAAERVRAKTGTLSGKSCLSGYVGDGHEVLVFSIFVDGIRNRRFTTMAVRAAQVSAVNAMMRFARGIVGEPPTEEVEPGVDFEVGEEITEADVEDKPDALETGGIKPGVARPPAAAEPPLRSVEPPPLRSAEPPVRSPEPREYREPNDRRPAAPRPRPAPIEPEVDIPDDVNGNIRTPAVPRTPPSSGSRRSSSLNSSGSPTAARR
jgi:serine-type D-Ala-D-Ala carboxypeptidase/endopeptidase (penicillin-binding protein 4)